MEVLETVIQPPTYIIILTIGMDSVSQNDDRESNFI